MTAQLIITAILIGLAAGILSGLVGIGGGIIMVPALLFFMNYTQHQAQGTSLAVLTLPVVILASFYYYNQCQILKKSLLLLGIDIHNHINNNNNNSNNNSNDYKVKKK